MARNWLLIAGIFGLAAVQKCTAEAARSSYCPVFYTERPDDCEPIPDTFLSFAANDLKAPGREFQVLEDAFDALIVLQRDYFDADYGTWPSAIDWTAAIAQTLVTGTLTTLSKSLGSVNLGNFSHWKEKENLISSFYDQVVSSYFAQDILSIRGQAYDDILWVVLGWIEAIKFVSIHSRLHYLEQPRGNSTASSGLAHILQTLPWHGHNWVCSFAHRARIFWNLAARGWDTRLCHGGMVWNPRLSPYKNAVTNELWITSSISMYQHFPGDNFTAPWLTSSGFPEKDPAHMTSAIEGYKWLKGVNMTNSQGLYVDGYHVNFAKPGNVECDVRDEMVYTYNQGIILTGQRGLWTVSGAVSYLEEGHNLVQSVINATGWSLKNSAPIDSLEHTRPGRLPPWHGIGRGGILEERCDATGQCSQDGQTFKGIFFHHLAAFCEPLEPFEAESGVTVDMKAYRRVEAAHTEACKSYLGWVQHNALAALGTRDSHGRFGMWWGAELFKNVMVSSDEDGIDHAVENTTDYRNQGTPEDDIWGREGRWLPGSGGLGRVELGHESLLYPDVSEKFLGEPRRSHDLGRVQTPMEQMAEDEDPNNRGRGRTVETQIGGLALLRAHWDMSQPT